MFFSFSFSFFWNIISKKRKTCLNPLPNDFCRILDKNKKREYSMLDLLIKNATIVDGTGSAPYIGNVGVKDGKLVTAPAKDAKAVRTVDAAGLVLAPGFIDAHCHEDETLGNKASMLSKVSQGITTVSCGNCGESYFPVSKDPEKLALIRQSKKEYLSAPDCANKDVFDTFTSFENYLAYAEKRPTAYDYTMLTGHGTLRVAAMGLANRQATEQELSLMKDLLRESMEHGSRGLSSGLIYTPSCYADERELTELCKVVADYDGYYAVHLRNEAGLLEESVAEAIRTAENAGCRLNLSHHKACGRENWGKTEKTLKMIREAQERGLFVYTDVYPYLATGNYINICLPKEFFENGQEKMAQLLREPSVRKEMKEYILSWQEGRYCNCGGFDNILICNAPAMPDAVNKTIGEYARELGRDEFEVYFDLCCENGGAGHAAYFAMSEDDLVRILLDDNAVIGTDSYDIGESNAVHPRSFGTFPLLLSEYVREKKIMPLEKMVRKMTGATADFMGLDGKGYIRDGYDADLVLFDPNTVAARADFRNSRELSDGIIEVFTAGQSVYRDKKLTGNCPGRFIPWKMQKL